MYDVCLLGGTFLGTNIGCLGLGFESSAPLRVWDYRRDEWFWVNVRVGVALRDEGMYGSMDMDECYM